MLINLIKSKLFGNLFRSDMSEDVGYAYQADEERGTVVRQQLYRVSHKKVPFTLEAYISATMGSFCKPNTSFGILLISSFQKSPRFSRLTQNG